ncbi:MAG: hypothetical protein RSC40_08395 [Clostridia bacterium]
MRNWHPAPLHPPAGERGIAEMAFRATGVGTAPHTGTYSFGAKEYAENSGTHSKQKPLDADEF